MLEVTFNKFPSDPVVRRVLYDPDTDVYWLHTVNLDNTKEDRMFELSEFEAINAYASLHHLNFEDAEHAINRMKLAYIM